MSKYPTVESTANNQTRFYDSPFAIKLTYLDRTNGDQYRLSMEP